VMRIFKFTLSLIINLLFPLSRTCQLPRSEGSEAGWGEKHFPLQLGCRTSSKGTHAHWTQLGPVSSLQRVCVHAMVPIWLVGGGSQ
jgi:hypothetical protein